MRVNHPMNTFVRPEQTHAWKTLCLLAADRPLNLTSLLADSSREGRLQLEAAGLQLDATRQRVDDAVLQALHQWAVEMGVMQRAQAMFAGSPVNDTEQRAALHVALRSSGTSAPTWGADISAQVEREQARFLSFAEQARAGAWLGHDGQSITDVVNIGIGGSDLGPRMACQALVPSTGSTGAGGGAAGDAARRLRVHFVSNPDPLALESTLARLQPARCAFIVQSKTFTTQETLTLAASARRWLQDGGCPDAAMNKHLVAVTAQPALALQQGFLEQHTFVFWDWVGGRYSVWSAIGLPLAMAIGATAFRKFLQGARAMDEHFISTAPEQNLPLTMALTGAWNRNFLQAHTLNLAPYAYALSLFPAFVAQLEMESNGKRTHLDGSTVATATAPVLWGGLGIDGQHAYFQLIHQGTQTVPVDFIGVRQTDSSLPLAGQQQQVVLVNLRAQAQALALGRDAEHTLAALAAEGLSAADAQRLCLHRSFPGNSPSSIIWMERLQPDTLGALIALYEHKVFCQAALWGINPFDQWGVELGKTMVRAMGRKA